MPRKHGRDSYDGPWKAVLEDNLPDFMQLCFPDLDAVIDWTQPWEFLEQELQQLSIAGLTGRQHVDKLVRVVLRNSTAAWLLIHIEIQSQYDVNFEQRIFRYYTRLYDRYQENVISLAVLGDANQDWLPNTFEINHWGCTVSMRFPYVKLIAMDRQKLLNTHNIMAAFILAHIDTIETSKNPQQRYERRIATYRRLLAQGFSGEQIRSLLYFIDWLMRLPPALEQQAYHVFQKLEEEYAVTYVTSFERYGIEKGRKEGFKQGHEEGHKQGQEEGREEGHVQGREEGREEGRIQGLQEGIMLALALKFGGPGNAAAALAQCTDLDQLQHIRDSLLAGATLEDICALLNQKG